MSRIFSGRKVNIIFAMLFPLLMSFAAISDAATYYVGTNGSDGSAGVSSAPWATFSKAMTVLRPSDTLVIKDGTYYQALNVTVSGAQGRPITIKAQNDGQATVDGGSTKIPCLISGRNNINIEGLIFKNSSGSVINVSNSNWINFKRISAYNAKNNGNYHIVETSASQFLLFEDCIASGVGRTLWTIYESDYVTLRRCWGKWSKYNSEWNVGIQIYGSNHCIIENNFLTTSSALKSHGITVGRQRYNAAADNNKVYGNILYGFKGYGIVTSAYGGRAGLIGNVFKDNVIINTWFGFGARTSADVENLTIINISNHKDSFGYAVDKSDKSLPLETTLKNSLLLTGPLGLKSDGSHFVHTYNAIHNIANRYYGTVAGKGEIFDNPGYDTATYGNGAYLMIPTALKSKGEGGADIGAQVLYRYQDGVLTSIPLWPWPMEDRILHETGVSATWQVRGGLWKTLDGVYGAK